MKDYLAAQRPDVLVVNSKVVQKRVTKYYRRESKIIHPPVAISRKVTKSSGEYYLCVSRLAKQKGIDLAIEACNQLGLTLKVVGKGSQADYLKSIAGPTISFTGYVPDQEMAEIYKHAKALIYCSIEEDFGIVPVEAMMHGVPVIGYRSGGTVETVVENKTGIFFDSYTVDDLKKAIIKSSKKKFSIAACINQAKKFSTARFKQQLGTVIKKKLDF